MVLTMLLTSTIGISEASSMAPILLRRKRRFSGVRPGSMSCSIG